MRLFIAYLCRLLNGMIFSTCYLLLTMFENVAAVKNTEINKQTNAAVVFVAKKNHLFNKQCDGFN